MQDVAEVIHRRLTKRHFENSLRKRMNEPRIYEEVPDLTPEAEKYLKEHTFCVFATGRKDGSPRQSLIGYQFDGRQFLLGGEDPLPPSEEASGSFIHDATFGIDKGEDPLPPSEGGLDKSDIAAPSGCITS